jgi:opacity protein-like surface antigen
LSGSVLLAAGLACVSATVGHAADPLDPVRVVMAVAGWKDKHAPEIPASDYFDDGLLSTIYSASFVDVYRLAQRTDELQDGAGYMLGYDVVIGGQDNCPLQDVRIEARPTRDGVTPIDVYFDASSCFGHPPDRARPQTVFHVVEEEGRPVIDNIWSEDYRDGALDSSIKAQFAALTKAYLDFRLTGSWPKE